MVRIKDIQERALTGPVMKEREYDKMLSKRVRELVKDYDIKFDMNQIIPDDSVADDVFKAGFDLLIDVGIYHLDTNRNIKFTENEIKEMIKSRPSEVKFGTGKDQITIKNRKPEEKTKPVITTGGGILSEDMFLPIVKSCAQEPTCQGINGFSLISAWGLDNKTGTPGEIMCAIAEGLWNREAVKSVGKPGLYIGLAGASALSPAGAIAAFHPDGYTKENAQIPIHLFNELKLTWSRFILATYARLNGIVPWTSYGAAIGLLFRNSEEASVGAIAALLAELAYGQGSLCMGGGMGSDGMVMRRESLASGATCTLALTNNLHVPVGGVGGGGGYAGPCTEMRVYEIAIINLMSVASGAGWLWYSGTLRTLINYCTGMEGRIMGETARAIAGMKRADANELINKLLPKIEDKENPEKAPMGKSFMECYDVKTLTPSKEYTDLYARVKKELIDYGIEYEY
jgi:methylamine--corrinoid protein Co-methyltransferase